MAICIQHRSLENGRHITKFDEIIEEHHQKLDTTPID